MIDNKDEIKKVLTDMTTDFNEKVSRLLEEIDILKQQLLYDKTKIPYLNERVHALYIKLCGKMTKEERGWQIIYKKKLSTINIGKIRPHQNEFGEIIKQFNLNLKSYKLYRYILEKREIHLNQILERVGLTARDAAKSRRIN